MMPETAASSPAAKRRRRRMRVLFGLELRASRKAWSHGGRCSSSAARMGPMEWVTASVEGEEARG